MVIRDGAIGMRQGARPDNNVEGPQGPARSIVNRSAPPLPLRDRPGPAILGIVAFAIVWIVTARFARRQTRAAIARGQSLTPDGPA